MEKKNLEADKMFRTPSVKYINHIGTYLNPLATKPSGNWLNLTWIVFYPRFWVQVIRALYKKEKILQVLFILVNVMPRFILQHNYLIP